MIHPQYTEVVRYPPAVMGMRWVWFHVCEWIAVASLLANFLPDSKRLGKHPRLCWWYGFLIHFIALLALNLRHCLPSLDMSFMGFRRKVARFHSEESDARTDR